MCEHQRHVEALIVGAGMAGLAAATELRRLGHTVLVVDKGRGVGGRVASRRLGRATFDHGAQFVTAQDPRFAARLAAWQRLGLAREWFRREGRSGVEPHWCGIPAMTALAKRVARGLDLRLATRVESLRPRTSGWSVVIEDGSTIDALAVLLTPPVPQSLALLEPAAVEIPRSVRRRLDAVEYERCLAVMAVLNDPSKIPAPGCVALADGPIAWIADNHQKGVSAVPAITIHASAAFSLDNWNRDRLASGRELLDAACPWLDADVVNFQVHAWRYSRPPRVHDVSCEVLQTSPPLVLAGDAFSGPRVEGAVLSGWAAAGALNGLIARAEAGA